MQMASPKLVNSKKDDFNKFVKKGYISQLLKNHRLGDDGTMARMCVIVVLLLGFLATFILFRPFSSISSTFIHFISTAGALVVVVV